MAVESPAFANQNSTYGAEQTRRAIGSLLARGSSVGSVLGGVVSSTDCLLTPPGSGMTVNVAPGEVWVPGSTSGTQSGYYARVSSSTSLAIATSDPSNPRIDRVVGLITDSAYSGVTNTFAVSVVTGTPTAGATLANLTGVGASPASSYTLGYVLVPATSTSVTGGNISNVAATVALSVQNLAGIVPQAKSALTAVTIQPHLALPPQMCSYSSNGVTQFAYAALLPSAIVSAAKVRWTYQQSTASALTGTYNIGIYNASGVQIITTGSASFTGAVGTLQSRAETITATTFAAGLYYVVVGFGTTAGSASYIGVQPLSSANSPVSMFAPVPDVLLYNSSGGTTLPSSIAAFTDANATATAASGGNPAPLPVVTLSQT